MKMKIFFLLLAVIFILSACGKNELEESITLLDHDKNEVVFPQEKPTLFFFITTYT